MYLIVSRDILSAIRHRLTVALPGIKTSLLAEAIAYALGAETNARLTETLKGDGQLVLTLMELDVDKFCSRLWELGVRQDPLELTEAFGAATNVAPAIAHVERITATGAEKFDLISRISKSAAAGQALLPSELVLLALADFAFRLDGTVDPVRHAYETAARPLGSAIPALSRIVHRMRDIDRPMADFLCHWISEVAVDPVAVSSAWGVPVFNLFRHRIEDLVKAIHLCWDDREEFPLGGALPVIKRSKRPVRLTMSTNINNGELGVLAAGEFEPSNTTIVGVLSLGLWLSGEAPVDIAAAVDGVMTSTSPVMEIMRLFPGTDVQVAGLLAGMRIDYSDLLAADMIVLENRELLSGLTCELEASCLAITHLFPSEGMKPPVGEQLSRYVAMRSDWYVVDCDDVAIPAPALEILTEAVSRLDAKLILVRPHADTLLALEPWITNQAARRGDGRPVIIETMGKRDADAGMDSRPSGCHP